MGWLVGWLVGLLADWAELSWVDRRVFRPEGVDGCLDHMLVLGLLWLYCGIYHGTYGQRKEQ